MRQKGIKDKNIFSALPELDISIAELQRHVAEAPAKKSSLLRYSSLGVMMATVIGIGLYVNFGNETTAGNETAKVFSAQGDNPATRVMPSLEKNAPVKISNLLAKKITNRKEHSFSQTIPHSKIAVREHLAIEDSALIDPKLFTAVCGRNVLIASTAKINPMQLLDPTNDFNSSLVNVPTAAFSN